MCATPAPLPFLTLYRVQEGLIFVGMSDDILPGTSGYKIDYGSTSPPLSPHLSPPSSVGDQLLSFQEAMNDPHIWETYRQGVEGLDMESLRLRNRQHLNEDEERWTRDQNRDGPERRSRDLWSLPPVSFPEICEDPPSDELPAIVGVSAPTPPPFTVLNESEDESEDDEEVPRQPSAWRGESDGEDDEDARYSRQHSRQHYPRQHSRFTRLWDDVSRDRTPLLQHYESARPTRRRSPSRIETKDSNAASEPVILPHAKFFIAKHKSKITIKFHPTM